MSRVSLFGCSLVRLSSRADAHANPCTCAHTMHQTPHRARVRARNDATLTASMSSRAGEVGRFPAWPGPNNLSSYSRSSRSNARILSLSLCVSLFLSRSPHSGNSPYRQNVSSLPPEAKNVRGPAHALLPAACTAVYVDVYGGCDDIHTYTHTHTHTHTYIHVHTHTRAHT